MNYIWENLFRRTDQDQDVLETLKNTYIFQTLSRKELRFLQGMVHVRTFRSGEPIFQQGEVGVGMYIVLKGALEIHAEKNHDSEVAARSQLVTKLRHGDFFGELSLVETNSRRSATAVATDDSVLIGFFKPDLLEILERQPHMGVKILLRLSEVLGRRLKETTIKVSELKDDLRRLNEKV